MSTAPRALSNNYKDCSFVKLDPKDRRSPIVVMQEGYAPNALSSRSRLFYLQHDGYWIDEVARSTRPDTEAGEVIFESSGAALKLLSSLFGKPLVRDLPVTPADTEAYLARLKSGSTAELLLQFLERYRAAKRKS